MNDLLSHERLTSRSGSILQDDLVNDLSADNASPPKIIFGPTIELFKSHRTSATVTFHKNIPSYGIIYPSPLEISRLAATNKDTDWEIWAYRVEANTYYSSIQVNLKSQ